MPDADRVRAFVLVGGLGLRLRSVTGDRPKSLATVGGRPFLHYVLAQLAREGLVDVTLCTGYGAEQIEAFVGDGGSWGLRVDHSHETTPLGTGGAVRLALERSEASQGLVLNGDSYFDISFRELLAAHRRLGGVATLAARRTEDAGRYGTVRISETGDVLAFDEKAAEGPADINAGVYVLERDALSWAPRTPAFSLERDLFPALVADGRLRAVPFDAFFIDIGIPAAHAAIDGDPTPLLGDPA